MASPQYPDILKRAERSIEATLKVAWNDLNPFCDAVIGRPMIINSINATPGPGDEHDKWEVEIRLVPLPESFTVQLKEEK